MDKYKNTNQTVKAIQAVLGDRDGMVKFAVANDLASMEGHVIPQELEGHRAARYRSKSVQSMTVKTFTRKYQVPTYFGLLSIDAEGIGNQVRHLYGN